jgi:hypothetical protein
MTDQTGEILREMLTENTGSHFLDSGGTPQYDANGNYVGSTHGYGRNHERNALRDFEAEKAAFVKFNVYRDNQLDLEIGINTYHWLKERLEYDAEMDELFHGRFLEEVDPDDDKSWLALMEEFPGWLEAQEDEDGDRVYGEFGGIYGEGEPFTVNTYNGECLLDQTLQFTYFCGNAGEFVLLQIHGGADVRGGYTRPRVFQGTGYSELAVLDYGRGRICCSGEDYHPTALALKEQQGKQLKLMGMPVEPGIDFDHHYDHGFYTDDGYHWYDENGKGTLSDYELKNLDDDDEEDVWEPGKLCVKDGVGYCPVCGAKMIGGS